MTRRKTLNQLISFEQFKNRISRKNSDENDTKKNEVIVIFTDQISINRFLIKKKKQINLIIKAKKK